VLNRPWFRRLTALFATFCALNLLAAVVGPQLDPPLFHYNWVAQHQEDLMRVVSDEQGCVDLAVIGSSIGLTGINPYTLTERVKGLHSAYNASLGGSFVQLDRDWYQRFVKPLLNPKVVVYVLPSVSLAHMDGAEAIQQKWDAAVATSSGPIADADRLATRYIPLAKYRSVLSDPTEYGVFFGEDPPTKNVPGKELTFMSPLGHMTVDQKANAKSAAKQQDFIAQTITASGQVVAVSPAETAALAEFLTQMKDEGTQVLVVIPPASPLFEKTLANLSHGTFTEEYKRQTNEITTRVGVPLLDASGRDLPEEWFYDTAHLNADAQKIFTGQVVDGLNKLKLGDMSCGAVGAAR
jgi:hypothetical protein